MEHFFTTYVRTKTVFKKRLKDLKDYDSVRIYLYELKKLGVNHGPFLYHLKTLGEISYDDRGNFRAMHKGPVDPSLLERTKKNKRVPVELTALHRYMRDQLLYVELIDCPDTSVYFKAFLEHRETQIEAFFTVDSFSGRVHTPVVNLKGDYRKMIRLCGDPVVSLDVKQMQPTILAKVLLDAVGPNSFSDSIFSGEDVYVLLMRSGAASTRAEAKTTLFKLIFGKPMNDISKMFIGDTKWVDWINSYKSKPEPKNPHKRDLHTNLAWLLQYNEVQVMSEVWQGLMDRRIRFLTIHDDVLCRAVDRDTAFAVMERVLKKHFPKFHINVDHVVDEG